MIEAEFGLKGFAIIVKLYQKIYGGFGYYCEWTNDVGLLFSQDVCEGYSSVSEIVSAAIRRGIFDKEMYRKYGILTSLDIQERYVRAKEKSQRVEMDGRYLLLSDVKIPKNVEIIGVYGEETMVFYPENSTKESKEKKNKEENSKEKKKKNARPQSGYDRILADIEDETLGFLFIGKGDLRKCLYQKHRAARTESRNTGSE